MKRVEYVLHGQEIHLRITEAFMVDGYRVLIDKEGCATTSWISGDGKTDRVFPTKEAAKNAILKYVNRLLECKVIESYIVY